MTAAAHPDDPVAAGVPGERPLSVEPLRPEDEDGWARLLNGSPNATLFHELPFLAYHPPGRFRFHHLVVRQGPAFRAVVPGGLAGPPDRPMFTSPLGASIGGPAFAPGLHASDTLAVIRALQEYAGRQAWGGIEVTIPPAAYAPALGEVLSFALFSRGFTLTQRWLCPMIPIDPGPGERYSRLFHARVPKFVRAARRAGIRVEDRGRDGLPAFLEVFRDTFGRHGAAATHTPEELDDLLARLPGRVRLFVATLDEAPVAGLLVLALSSRVAYTLYICTSTAHARAQGGIVAFAALVDWLGERGYSWLDLGPGASGLKFNDRVMFFKEKLGAIGHTRDRWTWTVGEPRD
jgi:hypothetical protein